MHWVVIADEVSALGWRLAGAQLEERLADARHGGADLVLITADLAKRLPDSVLDAALLAEKPLMVVIAGLASGSEPPDLEQQVKHVLGIAV